MDSIQGTIQATPKYRPKRLSNLQFLRFIAFFFILFLHAQEYNCIGFPVSNGAALAVAFFFMLSGFVTAYAHYGKEVKPTISNISSYIWKKLKKVYPLYLFTLLYTVMYTTIPGQITYWDFDEPDIFIQFIRCLFLMQSWKTTNYFDFNGVAWFLSSIFLAYFFALPALWAISKIREKKHHTGYFLGILCSLLFITISYCYLIRNNPNEAYWGYIFPPARLGEFFIGMILAELCVGITQKVSTPKIYTSLLFTGLEIAALTFWVGICFLYKDFDWKYRIVEWLLPNMFLLFVFSFNMGYISKVFSKNPFKFLGDISFECFLLHPLMISGGLGGISKRGSVFMIGLILLRTVFLASIIHKKNN